MEVKISDIKTALVLTFEDINSPFRDNSMLYPKKEAYQKIGILEGDYFIDIETKEFYPILFCDELGIPLEMPAFEVPYVYAIDSFVPRNEEEKNEYLKKCEEAHNWCETLKELEETGKIVSFQKRKIERKIV